MSDSTIRAMAQIRRMPTAKLRELERLSRTLGDDPETTADAAAYLARRTRNDENAHGRAIDAARILSGHARAEMIRRGCTF